MGGLDACARIENFDVAWSEPSEHALRGGAQKSAVAAVHRFKMPKEKEKLLKVHMRELPFTL